MLNAGQSVTELISNVRIPEDMTVEENLRLIEAADDALNAYDVDRLIGLCSEDFVFEAPLLPEPLNGPEAFGQFIGGFLTAFPDLQVETTRAFGQDDWVCVEHVTSGTHTGPMGTPDGQTIPPTNKKMRFEDVLVFRVKDDKITSRRLYFDQLGFMAQLGLVPEG